jgi:acyl-CoA synthetase (AMP-forming)/AMP-acid ligase II
MSRHQCQSLVDLLRGRAADLPETTAFTFLRDGEQEGERLTYGTLDRRSRAVATVLQDRIRPGDRALLLYPPGLEFIAAFFGCLYAGAVPVPAQAPSPIRRDRRLERLSAISADATPAAVLCTTEVRARVSRLTREGEAGGGARPLAPAWITTDSVPDREAANWVEPETGRQALAFLQYTSGSTAAPRGVMVTHGNLLENLAYACHLAGNDRSSVSVSWLPVTHDMGLIDGILQPVFSGSAAVLMSPAAFLQRPVRWLDAISRYRATRSGAPNFAYDLCVHRIDPAARRSLDLSTWRAAYNGAEPVRRQTLEAFSDAFAASGFRSSSFRPCYGLAEATLLVASDCWHRHDNGESVIVSCGRPAFGTEVLVVDPQSRRPCPDGETGEIWVAGPGVAPGYWNAPDERLRTFHALTAGGDGPFLRTGDLGFVRDRAIHVTGRLKDLLIVRGVKHYPQDLEHTAERQHAAIRRGSTAAFAIGTGPSGDQVALVAEADPSHFDAPGAARAATESIRRAIAECHGVQLEAAVLVPPATVPKTTSGKLQRFACREAFLAGALPIVWGDEEPDARPG